LVDDFSWGREGFRIKKTSGFIQPFTRKPKKTLTILATIFLIIHSNTTKKSLQFCRMVSVPGPKASKSLKIHLPENEKVHGRNKEVPKKSKLLKTF